MKALVFDKSKSDWADSSGFDLVDAPKPVLGPKDGKQVIIRVRYAGVCGTDKGIWKRAVFKDQILHSLAGENRTRRVIGHEFFGEVVEKGKLVKGLKLGDLVSCESHVVCNRCYQCRLGEKQVCTNEKILGISLDGGFAEYVKVPEHVIWKTNIKKIRPEIAAIQEPFGNAVHAATKTDLKGKTVAIFGIGSIGQFLTCVAKGLGAKTVIGLDVNPQALKIGKQLGLNHTILLKQSQGYKHQKEVAEKLSALTEGVGPDVCFEMSGHNSALNNAIFSVRRGGHVILFGLRNADFVFEDFNRLVMKGITLHAVAGRQLWKTWLTTRRLLENRTNGIQKKLWEVVLRQGRGTILDIRDFTKHAFEELMHKHSKFLIKF